METMEDFLEAVQSPVKAADGMPRKTNRRKFTDSWRQIQA